MSSGAPSNFGESVSVKADQTITGDKTFSGDTTLAGATAITGAATLSGATTTISSPTTTISGSLIASGGISSGVRQLVPFGMLNIAAGDNAAPASATPVQVFWCGASGLTTCGFVANRAGSVVGLSANINTAAAGSNLIVGVYKNGTIINAAAIVTLASATSDVKASGTFAQGSYTFVAGDVIDVRVRTGSGWSATAADMSCAVEIAT